jgi:hypothetical protein
MGTSATKYKFHKCVPVDDTFQPLFPCCGREIGNYVVRYRLLYKDKWNDVYSVTMSFCLLQERKKLQGNKLVTRLYSQNEIQFKLNQFAWSCINWPLPFFENCPTLQEPDYRIIFHTGLRYILEVPLVEDIDFVSESEEEEPKKKVEKDDVSIFLETQMYPLDGISHLISKVHSRFNKWTKETMDKSPITLNAFARAVRQKEPVYMCTRRNRGCVLLHQEFINK